jgi:hypothetical protein
MLLTQEVGTPWSLPYFPLNAWAAEHGETNLGKTISWAALREQFTPEESVLFSRESLKSLFLHMLGI